MDLTGRPARRLRTRPVLAGAAAAALVAGGLLAPVTAAPALVPTDTFIVTLGEGAPAPRLVADLTQALGGIVGHVYGSALQGFSVTLPTASAPALSLLPGVVAVERDQPVGLAQADPPSYGLDRIDQRGLPLNRSYVPRASGIGVTAYVVDTGINAGHVDFGGRASTGVDVIDGGAADDCNGHGTHVAGTIAGTAYGVAKDSRVKAVRVLGCDGNGTTAGVIAGVDWITADHQPGQWAVANLSLGGGRSVALDQAIARLHADGVVVVAAAGNSGGLINDLIGGSDACASSPASAPSAITVAATDSGDNRASYSNIGRCVDVWAPGSDITSTWIGGPRAAAVLSGTSMAAPHVAGVAAQYIQATQGASPAVITDQLLRAATPGVVRGAPASTVNRLVYAGR